jgi:DNA-3-methyladenine glycosylase II
MPGQAKPCKVLQDRSFEHGLGALRIDVFDAELQAAAMGSRHLVIDQRRIRMAKVQQAIRAGCKSEDWLVHGFRVASSSGACSDMEMPQPKPATLSVATELAALVALDPSLTPIVDAAGPLPDRRLEPGFAGLAWVVTGQQISVAACRAIYTRCETVLGTVTAETFAGAEDAVLRAAGQSAAKINTLRAAAAAVIDGRLNLDGLAADRVDDAMAQLTAIKGIGLWTAEVYLLFALGHPDIFPAGDLALQEAARVGLGLEARPTALMLRARAEAWHPYRGTAARLLWAYYAAIKQGRAAAPI